MEPRPKGPYPGDYGKPGYPSTKPWKHPETQSDCDAAQLGTLNGLVNANCPGHGYTDFPAASSLWQLWTWSCSDLEDLKNQWTPTCEELGRTLVFAAVITGTGLHLQMRSTRCHTHITYSGSIPALGMDAFLSRGCRDCRDAEEKLHLTSRAVDRARGWLRPLHGDDYTIAMSHWVVADGERYFRCLP